MAEVLPDGGDHGDPGAGETTGAGSAGASARTGGVGAELLDPGERRE
ncbi:MAG: hypothetical protein ACR2NR_12095 [Solirubrobacteraceae bacterium]